MSGTRAISTTSRHEPHQVSFPARQSAEGNYAILTETLACFLPVRAKDYLLAQRWSRCIAYSFVNLVAKGGWWLTPRFGRFTPNKYPVTHCTGGWVGPRTGRDVINVHTNIMCNVFEANVMKCGALFNFEPKTSKYRGSVSS